MQHVANQVLRIHILLVQRPQVQAAQALAGQTRHPVLRHGINGCFGLTHIGHGGLRHGRGEGPGHKFGVLLPAQVKRAQVNQHMGGGRIGQGAVVVAQQCRHMLAAGLALGSIGQHHDMRDGQRRLHDFRRTGVDFVVQQDPLRVLRGQ